MKIVIVQQDLDGNLKKNDTKTVMKRFNQAWLLNTNNPQAYWGFGIILARIFHESGVL